MKKLVFFITHATLSGEHAMMTFRSIAEQNIDHEKFEKFDRLYIYNTHSNELSNEDIIDLYYYFNLDKFFNELCVFPYDSTTTKSLGADVDAIKKYCEKNYDENDRILLLKSDCYLSKNYFSDIIAFDNSGDDGYFTAPFVVAKSRISNDEITLYGSRDSFIKSDNITFFVEDERNTPNNDFFNRKDVSVLDNDIRFISCRVQGDFSCHYIPIKYLKSLIITYDSWGGVKFYNIQHLCKSSDNSFVIHKYHGIISENRLSDREGPVKEWMNS